MIEEEVSEVKELPAVPQTKVGQEQIHDLLFADKLSWQAIIYDLINTEQLDPWDIDISLLANKYLEKVKNLEEANFFVSSKVLFAASLLLRIKSEILLNQDIPSLDDILFGAEEEGKKYTQERIELDEDLPDLIPRTPLPRSKKVTLPELMAALGKAIKTENRRINKEIVLRQYEREAEIVMPKRSVSLQESIKEIYTRLKDALSNEKKKMAFSDLDHKDKDDKILSFVSLLHLDHQQKVWLEQGRHFEEIYIWLKHLYDAENKEELDRIKKELEEFYESNSEEEKVVEIPLEEVLEAEAGEIKRVPVRGHDDED